jgi:hypothetical protein
MQVASRRIPSSMQYEAYRRHCEENGLPVLDLFGDA